MEKLSYSLIYLGPKPNPTPNRPSWPPLFLFHMHGPGKPAVAQPTPFHSASHRLVTPDSRPGSPLPSILIARPKQGRVASTGWTIIAFPVETAPKNQGSLSPREEILTESDQNGPRSNPTTLWDSVPAAHIKDPKSPINRTPSRRILAQNRAQTLEAPVVPSPRRCKPSPIGPVPRQPSTTSTAPTWSVPDDVRSLEPPPTIAQSRSLSRVIECRVSVPPPLKNDPGELPALLWPRRMKTQWVPLYGGLGLPSSGELQWSHHRVPAAPLPPLAGTTESRPIRNERTWLDPKNTPSPF
jgi:hypothetical protein